MDDQAAAAEVNRVIPKGEVGGITGVNLLMIDNYDSFTWNLYQYLCILGAKVTVVRSQSCTIDELIANHPDITHLVISPGPGHPLRDSGISIPALQHYAGKIPIFGVCMGLQCTYSAYGGIVDGAGEIVHGKTSPVRHDGKGLFKGVSQNIKSTRYHSLAARISTLPADMEVTSRCGGDPNSMDDGIVMGIRHKVHAIEAVQYHPESILSEEGHNVMANFLRLRGGTWAENPSFGVGTSTTTSASAASRSMPSTSSPLPSILQRICKQRIVDVETAKSSPGSSHADLRARLNLHVAPPQIDFYNRLRAAISGPGEVALMAEIKRASPSKGSFVTQETPSPPEIALSYALAGASTISVLTEPGWFKGSLQDMLNVRLSLEGVVNRPAILRKDFILDPYQIDEARCYGADTVLLIVACLDDNNLKLLYQRSKELGMEPLVEVNNALELERALQIGAKVIGVNNRNLHDFKVDMGTTSRLADVIRARKGENADVILCALSGITGRPDVQRYVKEGVRAVLVGEALMKAPYKGEFVRHLLGTTASVSLAPPDGLRAGTPVGLGSPSATPLVKICGLTDAQQAVAAVEAGADMIGIMFAPNSKRRVDIGQAQQIAYSIRAATAERLKAHAIDSTSVLSQNQTESHGVDWFTFQASRLAKAARRRPLIVGVFQNASLDEIIHTADAVPLDVVQLHGSEPVEWARILNVPVIRAFHVGRQADQGLREVSRKGYHAIPLLDTAQTGFDTNGASALSGGTGQTFDWSIAKKIGDRDANISAGTATERLPIMLAGGLTPANVTQAIQEAQPWCVDVGSGVEISGGQKDIEKVRQFIKAVKGTLSA